MTCERQWVPSWIRHGSRFESGHSKLPATSMSWKCSQNRSKRPMVYCDYTVKGQKSKKAWASVRAESSRSKSLSSDQLGNRHDSRDSSFRREYWEHQSQEGHTETDWLKLRCSRKKHRQRHVSCRQCENKARKSPEWVQRVPVHCSLFYDYTGKKWSVTIRKK